MLHLYRKKKDRFLTTQIFNNYKHWYLHRSKHYTFQCEYLYRAGKATYEKGGSYKMLHSVQGYANNCNFHH